MPTVKGASIELAVRGWATASKDWEVFKFAYILLKYFMGWPIYWFDLAIFFSKVTVVSEEVVRPVPTIPLVPPAKRGRAGSVVSGGTFRASNSTRQ
jgi:hypothetical protein